MSRIDSVSQIKNLLTEDFTKAKKVKKEEVKKDTIEISNTSKAFAKVENFLNLGKTDRLDVSDLNEAEKEEFYKMLAKLIKAGIVGYEILEVNGKPEKHYIVNEIGDQRLKGAKLYKRPGYYKD